ncbi:MAG: hypothetical protein IAG13_24705 [Deltaproteobacteria bacterium]|nr:hypothetical protein [Nannocystaceae bacterium]
MKGSSSIVVWLGVALVAAAACGGSQTAGQPAAPVVITGPNDFVMRDVRKDAARRLDCQVPDVGAIVGSWAGAEGNVTAYGCGNEINYYLRCVTSHQCTISATD